ncbi:putative kinesin [Leishmania mexicana MHOM/GT/2001/U1103]|uniref:Kinesin n=1 Tax=Leishmania mexicana (strain MHOM/GT/2001/U1103) TaxID=929439 RepID=E9ALX5_LEIMU|nr:putative kinesin [Leishmania mexicana MHOM/GT/2001/U1103]CBZ23930.1 putative kinesin [Leishmania mexicana MHOM/GT/2001/U1103]
MLPRELARSPRMSSGGSAMTQPKRPTGPPGTRPVSAASPLIALSQNQLPLRSSTPLPPRNRVSSTAASRPSCSISGSFQPTPSILGAQEEKVRVAVRCRPPNVAHGERSDDVIVSMNPSANEVYLLDQEAAPWRLDMPLWSCSGVALDGSQAMSQAGVYEAVGRPLLQHALEGYNSTLMAYGQTGSGKTYTMMGDHRDDEDGEGAGIIPRMCRDLFHELNNRSFTAPSGERLSWEVHVRYVEVYCEKISDLLNCGASVGIREEITPQSATFALVGARRVKVAATDDLLQALAIGNKWRRTASTKLNDRSSRSHALFLIDLTEIISFTEPDGTVASAPSKGLSIRLVDLAGSERVSETGVHGQKLREVKDINLSLFTLGCVIECLSDPKRRGIKPPYRDSVLTKLLRDAFGGNSKTTMVCTISPCEAQHLQTVQTLHYAAKARHVLNKPRVKEDPSAMELRRANEELVALRRQLDEAQHNGNHYESIEAELREANMRLRREQKEARLRKQVMERREADLAARMRELEDQREAYEAQMQALEAEVERARVQQEKREKELRRAHEMATEYARVRLEEMEEQCVSAEAVLRTREEELVKKQRAIEEKMRTAEASSRCRIDELQRQQKDMENALKEKERLTSMHEREMRHKYKQAEDDLRAMEKRNFQIEEEWSAKVRALEATAKQREEDVAQRIREAQAAQCKAEAAARRREEELQQKWIETDNEARRVQSEVAAKEAELKRRVQEAHRRTDQREEELNERLRKAEYELGRRERETAQKLLEVETLRQATELQSETTRAKERTMKEVHSVRTESLQALEAQLQQRQEELRRQFDEVMQMKRAWNVQQAEQRQKLEAEHEAALQTVKQWETDVSQRDIELRRQNDELAGKLRAQEIQLEKQQMMLLADKNEFETAMQRDRRAMLRTREEMQLAQDRNDVDCKMRQDKLREWETELRDRRAGMEATQREREAALRQKEMALVALQDATMAKEVELYQAQERLKAEQADLQGVAKATEAERGRLQANCTRLQRFEMRLGGVADDGVFDPVALDDARMTAEYMACQGHAESSADVLNRREQRYFCAFESMYRANILAEERIEFRSLARSNQLEARDIQRCVEVMRMQEVTNALQAKLNAALSESKAAESRATASQGQVGTLREELESLRRQALEMKVQMGSAVSAAQFAEGQVRQLRLEAYEADAKHRDREQECQSAVIKAQSAATAAAHRQGLLHQLTMRVLLACEEEQRSLLEHHQTSELQSLHLLQISDRRVLDREGAIHKWQSLYRRRSEENTSTRAKDDAARQRLTDEDAQRLRNLQRTGDVLTRREGCLAAERERFEQRVLDFESCQRAQTTELSRQEQEVKGYLLELEEMDQRKMREYAERERRLVEMAEHLKMRQARIGTCAQDLFQSLLQRSVEQQPVLAEAHEELERVSVQHTKYMTLERQLIEQAQRGNADATQQLAKLHEEYIASEKHQLKRRARRLEEEEARNKQRLVEQEAEIHRYLLEIEAEDVRRNALSHQGEELMRKAEERLSKAQFKEAALRDLARQIHLEAMESEEQARTMETTVRRAEKSTREKLRHRKVELEQLQRAASSAAEYNERTLLDMEADLLTIVNKNKDAEHVIKTREAEIKRQKMYYMDLSKMLGERNEMLRKEHALRLCGKKNAGSLAKDLLDVNDSLRKQVSTWKQKFDVLLSEGKIECEKCSWKNKRDTSMCMCCGHAGLLELSQTC